MVQCHTRSMIMTEEPDDEGKRMNKQYGNYAKIFKALSDPKRVRIVDLLSCGKCAAAYC